MVYIVYVINSNLTECKFSSTKHMNDNIPEHLQAELERQEQPDVCTICGEQHHVEDCKIYEEEVEE